MGNGQGRVRVTEVKAKVNSGLNGGIDGREGRFLSVRGGWVTDCAIRAGLYLVA